jgi:DNA-binding GntR family transcriptional regulator
VAAPRFNYFEALARPLRDRIRSGELRPGALLPSESELARTAGTKRYSIRKALMLLRDEGLIHPVAGHGWTVVSCAASECPGALPRYREIAGELRSAIERGELPAGAPLASETTLTRRYAASRGTVRQALALLETDRLITTKPGRGRYVRDQ